MELTASEAWARILERARPLLPEPTFRIWLEQTEPLALSEDRLAVGTGSDFAAEWIEDKYGPLLGDVAERVFGRRLTISFRHRPREAGERRPPPATGPSSPAHPPSAQAPPAGSARATVAVGAPLNERYSFERFVVGPSNQLASAACRAVAEAPARMYNPLFIYG